MVERRAGLDSVLVPIDESDLADEALVYALEQHPDADITALHVIELFAESRSMPYGPAPSADFWDTLDEYARDQAEAILEEAHDLADEHGVEIATEMERGEPARTIVDYAEEEGSDCIVIGSHGRTGVTRVLLGSVAEKVMRHAPCPVTVVR